MVTIIIQKVYIVAVFVLLGSVAYSQQPTVLTLAPDSRSTGMADMGVATSADVNAQYFNVSKYAFADKGGISVSYSPWMRKLASDMNAVYLAGYGEIGTNNYISGSVAYFSVGNITLSDGVTAMETNPSEWAIDLGYSRRLTPYLSLGVAFRYASAIYADLNALNILHAGAFAVDAGAYFQLPVGQNKIFAGVSITNIGTQFQFADTTASLPTALRLGVNYTFNFTPEHGLSLGVEGNQPFVSGAKNSFDRATFGFGAEYSWKQTLMARAGYFYNNKNYGDRSHVSIGVGGRLEGFGVDASYWIPTSSSNTALDNTFHITLSYIFR